MDTPWFAAPTVKTETSSAEAGEHNSEALCFGNCCNTKYSTESAVAGARLICPSREDYKASPWQCPAEPLLNLSKGQEREQARALTPLLNSSSTISYQAQQVFLVSHSAALHSILAPSSINEFTSSPHALRSPLPSSYSVKGEGNENASLPHEHPLVFPHTQHPV